MNRGYWQHVRGVNISCVFAISEIFYDILFRQEKPVSACPGGAMLNSAVSLGRAGIPVELVSELGSDVLGDMICSFLEENAVYTQQISRYHKRRSPLALAFLDSDNNAHYSFYEDFPPDRAFNVSRGFTQEDFVMFGSIFACLEPLSYELKRILDIAVAAGATILYDPNIRKAFIPDIENVRPLIDSNIRYADIVRASDEDMLSLGGCRSADEAYEYVLVAGCDHLIYTTAGGGVYLRTPSLSKYYKTPDIETVSTVGAGDSFNAGVVNTLYRKGINRKRLKSIPEAAWDDIIKTGIAFAAEVCTSDENYISMQYALGLASGEPDTNIYKC